MSWAYQEFNLDDLGYMGRGKSKHRPRNDPDLFGGDYPFVQTGDVKAANLHLTDFSETYSELGLAQSKIWNKGTLLITIAANIAETAVLGMDACFPDSIVGFIPDETKVNAYFVKYYIDFIKQQMQQISQGTTQDNLSLDKLRTFNFKVPEKRIVDKITLQILTYDNLIENNNRRIAILEEMAHSLYREWFVKFHFPDHEKCQFKDSPLGQIPEGWGVKRLDDYVVLQRGFDLPKKIRNESGEIPIYAASGINGYHDVAKVKPPGLVTGRSGTLGVVKLVLEDFWPLNTSLWVKQFKKCQAYYGYYLLKSIGLEQFNSGAAVPTLNRNDVHGLNVVAPPVSTISNFESVVESVFAQIEVLTKKNKFLKEQRDMLLPKLIAGKINLNEASQ